jgi:hypothetical protein
LIDDFGPEVIIDAIDRLDSEQTAELTVSTAHKAKGREWPTVRIGSDFADLREEPGGIPGRICEEDARLAYVAVTRARYQLDLGGLSGLGRLLSRAVCVLPWNCLAGGCRIRPSSTIPLTTLLVYGTKRLPYSYLPNSCRFPAGGGNEGRV